jgi:hypothetical protein
MLSPKLIRLKLGVGWVIGMIELCLYEQVCLLPISMALAPYS